MQQAMDACACTLASPSHAVAGGDCLLAPNISCLQDGEQLFMFPRPPGRAWVRQRC